VPIVLATLPVTAGLPSAERIFDVTFLLVVMFTLIQGPTLSWLARKLRVAVPEQTRELAIENAPFEDAGATMLSFDIPAGSRLHGVEVSELRLPGEAVVALVLRDGELFVPQPTSPLRHGDHLLLAAPVTQVDAVEQRLRAISRGGRLAGWYDDSGLVSA
jgi:cell volume regulation protein A